MESDTLDVARLAAMDSREATRLLQRVRAATLAGRRPTVVPRKDIGESWRRALSSGLDPDGGRHAGILSAAEVERRRRHSPLTDVLPVLRDALVSVADAAQHIMVVSDAEGRVLWREGHASVLRLADTLGFEVGADWSEPAVGTNGVGTPLVTRRPVQVFSAEHFVSAHHTWTCAGAPVVDPRDGRLIGVVDVSGPLATMHPATLSFVTSVTRLAAAELRAQHLRALERLRAVAAPVLCRVGGRALAVDANGWVAAVTGMPPRDRLALPAAPPTGRVWLPSLGMCTVEPLPGGRLVQAVDGAGGAPAAGALRVVLDLSRPRHRSVTVSGDAGSWTQELSPRHAELLFVLALHREGRSAAQLAQDIFEDPTRTVTVRAEMSRLRRRLAEVLAHRPYRFGEGVRVEVIRPDRAADLLPRSSSPAVRAARERQA
ncbi:helix-turn-helix domain-containing protein [Streptomyces sp. NBC_00083]|uniref:helix-turn-helix domain-containing protein n=1 Tax=Streptomyces sp. NBC_00083 TaxID=2975647 RepID=UPI00224DAAA2|nr:helix-turn-helix domain-containing protein [Streptomyces sp. NBC_00083]MCX5386359.1 GAF domain-containing protein [Streptomyces sp. NBC_00083]